MSKTNNTELEHNVMKDIQEWLSKEFDVKRAFDGCNVDMMYRPLSSNEDKWVGIQVKTTQHRNRTYGFHINASYKNCLLLLYCCEDKRLWIIPENIITISKIDIGYRTSKYSIYQCEVESINERLGKLYEATSKHMFETIDQPTSLYTQREKEFRRYREEMIPFLPFVSSEREGTVYDFMIGSYKVQEKVCKRNEKTNKYTFCLYKNNGIRDKKRVFCSYEIGDNDFYWLQCADKRFFLVIPEKVLIMKGLIGTMKAKYIIIRLTEKGTLPKTSQWLQEYLFHYETLDKERLLCAFSKSAQNIS